MKISHKVLGVGIVVTISLLVVLAYSKYSQTSSKHTSPQLSHETAKSEEKQKTSEDVPKGTASEDFPTGEKETSEAEEEPEENISISEEEPEDVEFEPIAKPEASKTGEKWPEKEISEAEKEEIRGAEKREVSKAEKAAATASKIPLPETSKFSGARRLYPSEKAEPRVPVEGPKKASISKKDEPIPSTAGAGKAMPNIPEKGEKIPSKSTQVEPVPSTAGAGKAMPNIPEKGPKKASISKQVEPVPSTSGAGKAMPNIPKEGPKKESISKQVEPIPSTAGTGKPMPYIPEKGEKIPSVSKKAKSAPIVSEKRPEKLSSSEEGKKIPSVSKKAEPTPTVAKEVKEEPAIPEKSREEEIVSPYQEEGFYTPRELSTEELEEEGQETYKDIPQEGIPQELTGVKFTIPSKPSKPLNQVISTLLCLPEFKEKIFNTELGKKFKKIYETQDLTEKNNLCTDLFKRNCGIEYSMAPDMGKLFRILLKNMDRKELGDQWSEKNLKLDVLQKSNVFNLFGTFEETSIRTKNYHKANVHKLNSNLVSLEKDINNLFNLDGRNIVSILHYPKYFIFSIQKKGCSIKLSIDTLINIKIQNEEYALKVIGVSGKVYVRLNGKWYEIDGENINEYAGDCTGVEYIIYELQ